jgi:hypothetical protein
LHPIFIVSIGNISQYISLIKFASKERKEREAQKSIFHINSEFIQKNDKKKLVRSLSSVFRVEEYEENDSESDSDGWKNYSKNQIHKSERRVNSSKKTKRAVLRKGHSYNLNFGKKLF